MADMGHAKANWLSGLDWSKRALWPDCTTVYPFFPTKCSSVDCTNRNVKNVFRPAVHNTPTHYCLQFFLGWLSLSHFCCLPFLLFFLPPQICIDQVESLRRPKIKWKRMERINNWL